MNSPEISCPTCKEPFSDERIPKTLECGHSLCAHCTDHIFQIDCYRCCPECQKPITVCTAFDLNVNYSLLELIQSINACKNDYNTSVSEDTLENRASEEEDCLFIDDCSNIGPVWKCTLSRITCKITSSETRSKYMGMGYQLIYTVQPSFRCKQIERNYKDFQWLHNQLSAMYPLVILPPIPRKNNHLFKGKTMKKTLIKLHTLNLQSWIEKLCHHPVISKSTILYLFMSSKTPIKDTSVGKIIDELISSMCSPTGSQEYLLNNFFSSIRLQKSSINMSQMHQRLEEHDRCACNLAKSFKVLRNVCKTQGDKYSATYNQENKIISNSFKVLSHVFDMDVCPNSDDNSRVTFIADNISRAYEDIGSMYEEENGKCWKSLGDMLLYYEGLLDKVQKVQSTAKKFINRWETQVDVDVTQNDSRVLLTDVDKAVISAHILQAELVYFHQQRVREFKENVTKFLTSQVQLYQMIGNRLSASLHSVCSEEAI